MARALPEPLAALTPRGRLTLLAALALLGLGLWWHYPVLAGLGGILTALVLAELAACYGTPRVVVRREVDPRVVVRGASCRGELRLAGRPRTGLARLDVADQVDGRRVPVALPRGAGDTGVGYDIPTSRRGLVDVGPLHVRRSGLTGMASRSAEAGEVLQVRVLPRRIPLTGMAPGHRRAVNAGGDAIEHGGTDLVGLHEYTVGDDLRRLHWPTSARTGTLMVREDADPSEPHLFVLLDDRAASYPGPGAEFEEAVELAQALCHAAVAAGNPLRFRTASGLAEVDVAGRDAGLRSPEAEHLEWLLAEIQPVEEPALADLGTRDLDVFAAVTGRDADLPDLALAAASAISQYVLLVDPAPAAGVEQRAGLVLLRGRTSTDLAAAWERTVAR